jgi:hypothetical protein
MPDGNPEQERSRLQREYSRMTDEELREIAEDGASLTAEAVQVLTAEIARRGLDISVSASGQEEDRVRQRELVTIRRFRDLPEAMLAKGILDSAGIECFVVDDNIVRLNWFISTGIGGIKIQVNKSDAEAASELFAQPIPDGFDVDGAGNYQQPRCPKCQSVDTTFQELYKPLAYTSAWLCVPLPIHRRAWRCKACGHEWEDEGSASDNGA